MESDAMILVFWVLSFKPAFSLSSFTLIRRPSTSSSFSAIRMMSPAHLRLLFLPGILIAVCDSSSPAFRMIYSVYELNKQADNIKPCHNPFPVWNQSVISCLVLIVASGSTYKFLRRQVSQFGTISFLKYPLIIGLSVTSIVMSLFHFLYWKFTFSFLFFIYQSYYGFVNFIEFLKKKKLQFLELLYCISAFYFIDFFPS